MNRKKNSQSTARISRNVVALGVVSFFTDAASEMIYPLVPIYITLLGSGAFILGIIEGVAETTAAMLKLISGIISDKIGKRKLLVVIGYGISTLMRPLTAAVSAAWQIVFIRMADRIGKGIRTSPRDALIASSVDDSVRGKAFGLHRAMDHAGAVAGPIFAIAALVILILHFRMQDTLLILRWTFLLAIIPGLFALLALLFLVQEKAKASTATAIPSFSLNRFDRNFIAYLWIVFLFTLGNSSDAFLLLRVQQVLETNSAINSAIYSMPLVGEMVSKFGGPETQQKLINILLIPLVWAFFHVIKVLFSTRLGALSDKIGRKKVINTGWGIYAFVYFAFALLDRVANSWQLAATLVLFAIYALYYAFCEGAEKAFVADMVKPELRGSAFGLFNFSIGLGALPASIIFGFLYKVFGATVAFGMGASLAGLAMLLLATAVQEKFDSSGTDR